MKDMKILKDSTTGDISKIFDPASVDVIEVSDCGREVWATLKSGYRFRMFELRASSNYDVQQFLENVLKRFYPKKDS